MSEQGEQFEIRQYADESGMTAWRVVRPLSGGGREIVGEKMSEAWANLVASALNAQAERDALLERAEAALGHIQAAIHLARTDKSSEHRYAIDDVLRLEDEKIADLLSDIRKARAVKGER